MTLIACMARNPSAGGSRPSACITKLEKAKKTPAIRPLPKAAKTIKKTLLNKKLIGDPKDATDVFRYRTRSFSTGHKTSGLAFPAIDFGDSKYGVSVGDKVYFFTDKGEETK